MSQSNSIFSIARKGYDCSEVDLYVSALKESLAQLQESFAQLRDKHDALCTESDRDKADLTNLRNDCTALAVALKKLREESANSTPAVSEGANNSAEYEAALKENEELKAQIEALKAQKADEGGCADNYKAEYEAAAKENEQLKAEIEALKAAQVSQSTVSTTEYSEAATKMIAEVAAVVQKLEKDARRKADAITLSAKLEQERASIIKGRVQHEIRSLREMLDSYLDEEPETQDE